MRFGILGIASTGLAILAACGGLLLSRRADTAPLLLPLPSNDARAAVIVELFSSEGCSSCPPADAYLATLDRDQPIDGVTVIALEEHVDYWDRLGWRDPFGSPAFSARQSAYSRVLADRRVFTPEIVFDGHTVMDGGDEDAARTSMQMSAREPKARVALRRDDAKISVDVGSLPPASGDDVAEVWLAITETGLRTDVRSGENAGRRLAHAPVVRELRSLGRVSGASFHADAALALSSSWKPSALKVVVFVQRETSRKIIGAAVL